MKLSVVISTQPAAFSALAFKGRLEENIAKISALGYDGVELAVRDPAELDVSAIHTWLTKLNLQVPAIGTGQAYGEEGLSLTHPEKRIRRKAINRINSQAELSDHLGSVVIIGLVRGKIDQGVTSSQAERWLLEALSECAQNNENITFAIEPINRYETDLINTVQSGLKFVKKINRLNVGLLLDTFHMNIEEPSMLDSIKSTQDRLFHFHLADSNRWYPGAGHIDFREIIETLDQIGYQGFVSAEIMPLPDPVTAVEKTIEYMRGIIN